MFLFQFGTFLDVDNTTLLMASNCHFCNKGYPEVVRSGMYTLENGIVPQHLEFFPDYSRNLHGKFLNGTFPIDLSKSEAVFLTENFLPMFYQLILFLPISQALNFDWAIEAVEMSEDVPADAVLPDGNFTGQVGEILKRKSSFGLTYYNHQIFHVLELPAAI